ncbi:hypothetical protein ASNO1_62720 [Corallococcus caeni]|uniref:Uncharacterized protein n=1 Tax=Corallococcus caeni TaxID=3082388 RepID=A0ABQ6R3G4_9BACT|nr:hypothetical protein ASNO1_62720 [Corallococcus sp. NO1]
MRVASERTASRPRLGHGGRSGQLHTAGKDTNGRLGGAVVVVHLAVGSECMDGLEQGPGGGLTAEHQTLARQDVARLGSGEQRRQVRGHHLHAVDGVTREVVGEGRGTGGALLGEDVEQAPRGEGGEEDGVAQVGDEGGDKREACAGLQAKALRHRVDVGEKLGVRDGDALGPAGGAGGEEDVGEGVRMGLNRRGVGAQSGEGCRVFIQANDVRGRDKGGGVAGHRHDDGRGDFLHQGLQAQRRLCRVQRHVGTAGLPDAQQGDDSLNGALQAQGDARVGADA